MDQLASAAGKALGSFWTGIGGALSTGMQAASNIAGQIETAAVQAASRVTETTKEHAPWSVTQTPRIHACHALLRDAGAAYVWRCAPVCIPQIIDACRPVV